LSQIKNIGDDEIANDTGDIAIHSQCSSYCCGESYHLSRISDFFTDEGFIYKRYGRDVLHIDATTLIRLSQGKPPGDIFIYSYGCIVFWGVDEVDETKIIQSLRRFLDKPLQKVKVDRCSYSINSSLTATFIDNKHDEICFHHHDSHMALAFSYGLSQSIKLSSFEESVQRTIEKNRSIPEALISTGKIALSKRELAKKIGVLFLERNFINLNSDIFDTPEFFWRRPRYEPYYESSLKFMDIKQRVQILNNRLDVINDLYGIMAAELQHVHSLRLEVIIVILISIEVVFAILRDVLHWI